MIEEFYILGYKADIQLLTTCSRAGFLLSLFFDSEDGLDTFRRNVGLTFNGLDGVVFQKIELVITTAVRTPNPTYCLIILSELLI
jgi:hypothetical protein